MVINWIQKIKIKKGALHKELGISSGIKIPVTLLNKIIFVKAGDVIVNPTSLGFKKIKVNQKLKRRAVLARNFKKI